MKTRNFRYSSFLPALAVISLSMPSVFAATGIWNGTAGGGDGFWDISAITEWSGVTGNAWDATNGPNNIAQFNSGVGSNPGTSGQPVANGIIWNGVGGGVSSGAGVKLDGANPFINVNTTGQTSQMFAGFAGTNGFTKTGAGQFFLISTVKAITGGITVNQGLLRLDLNTVVTASGVAISTNAMTLSGSTLELQGKGGGDASSQTLDNFTLNTGGSTIRTNLNGGSGVTLSLANWTRTPGTNANVLIDTSSGAGNKVTLTGTLPTLLNDLIGGYATIKDSTGYGFATLSGNDVVRYTGATTVGAALGADTVSTTNYKTTAAGTFFNGSGTSQFLNSLDVAFNGNVSGNNAATYVLGSGGLMFSYSSGFPGYKADMNFTSATSELQVSVLPYNNGFAPATIRGVADNGGTSVSLVKGGVGGLNMGSGAFTYTGDTVVNQGILDNIANIPSGAGKGNLVVNAQGIVSLGLGASGTRTINGLSNTTLGGGIVNNQNYTSTAATAFLDLGNNDAIATFSGVISGNFSLIKSGIGTQTLSGANTYIGTTAVNAGTLALVRGSQASPITVNSGAALGFTVGSPTTSSSTVTFNASSKVKVTGTPAAVTLMTASSISGTPVLDPAIPGYTLQVTATELKLVAGGATPYDIWAATYLPADVSNPAGDNDNDGLANQQEFAFGLNPTSGSSVNPILVQLDKTTGTFNYQRRAGTGLTYKILISTTLAAGSWTEDAGAGQVATPSGQNENVVVTLSGAPLTGEKLFVRVAAQ